MFPGSQVRVVQCRRKKQRAGGGRPPGIPQIPAARCGPEVEVWRCGGVTVWLWARPTRERRWPRGGARAGGGGSRGAGAAGAVRWPCAGSGRQRCSTAGKPRWAPPSPCPSFFSWQRPTSGASYPAQPLPFAYVQARRAPRWGAEPAPFASQRSRVWRECEQRESRPTARAGSGVIRVPPAPAPR